MPSPAPDTLDYGSLLELHRPPDFGIFLRRQVAIHRSVGHALAFLFPNDPACIRQFVGGLFYLFAPDPRRFLQLSQPMNPARPCRLDSPKDDFKIGLVGVGLTRGLGLGRSLLPRETAACVPTSRQGCNGPPQSCRQVAGAVFLVYQRDVPALGLGPGLAEAAQRHPIDGGPFML